MNSLGTVRVDTSIDVGTLSGNGSILLSSGNLHIHQTSTFAGNIFGIGSLHQESGGTTLTLSGSNSYTGGTNIKAGKLELGANNVLSDSGNVFITNPAAIFSVNGKTDRIGGLYGNGFVDLGVGGRLMMSNGAITGLGPDANFSGLIGGFGDVEATVGHQRLSSSNTFIGNVRASNGGQMWVSSNSNLGDSNNSIVLTNGKLVVDGSFATGRTINLAGGIGYIEVQGGNQLTLAGPISGPGSFLRNQGGAGLLRIGSAAGSVSILGLQWDSVGGVIVEQSQNLGFVSLGGASELNLQGADNTIRGISGSVGTDLFLNGSTSQVTRIIGSGRFNGVISGFGGLAMEAGTQTLEGSNTYLGGNQLRGGTLSVSSNSNLGDASTGLRFQGGTLRTTASFNLNRDVEISAGQGQFSVDFGTVLDATGPIHGAGTFVKSGDGQMRLLGNNSYAGGTIIRGGRLTGTVDTILGNVAFEGSVFPRKTLEFVSDSEATFNRTISGNGDVEVNGSGILNLTSANTYQGDTRIGAGSTLAAYADGAIGFGEVIVSDDATLIIDGSQQTVADVRNYGDILMADGVLNSIGETFIDHTARLRGTVRVDGRVRNLGSVEASAGGLEFTGDVVGDGSFSGENLFSGTYGPGNSPALVTHGDTSFGSLSVLTMELGGLLRGSEYDAINALTLNLNGVLKVDLIDIGMGTFMPSLGNTFDLLMANSISGMFSDFNFTGATLASGLTWSWNVFNSGASDIFRLMVVAVPPEGAPAPGALAILVIGIAGFTAARRRRGPSHLAF